MTLTPEEHARLAHIEKWDVGFGDLTRDIEWLITLVRRLDQGEDDEEQHRTGAA